MVNLIPVTLNNIGEFIKIANDKYNKAGNNRKDRILNLVPAITVRYQLYSHHFGLNTLEQITTHGFTAAEKSDLLHCYNVATKSLNILVRAIKDNQMPHLHGICQFCGINTDSTTDHYLPKGQFPDFCINPLNLFPCCPECNSLKNEYFWDAIAGCRGIINFYLDTIPPLQFLYADIVFTGNVPAVLFSLSNTNGVDPGLYEIIVRHFDRLNLLSRYKDKFNSVYHQTYSSFRDKTRFRGHPGRVRDFLLDDARVLFRDYGRNYYKAIIKEALANSTDFLNSF